MSAATRTRMPSNRTASRYNVDTGFIVFNDWTYPNFIALLDELGVPSQESAMSFSVRAEHSGIEYNGTSLNTLFAQRRNLLRPSFLRMIRDILRFNREAPALLASAGDDITLGDYLAAQRYSRAFIEHYIIPMGAAIWSTDPENMQRFPARYFVRFFHNHGMLSVDQRPQWRVIQGGSARYVETTHRAVPRTHPPAHPGRVDPAASGSGAGEACGRADRTLRPGVPRLPQRSGAGAAGGCLRRRNARCWAPSPTRRTRRCCTPTRGCCRAASSPGRHGTTTCCRSARERVALTYNMNILQGLNAPTPFLVTLNHSAAIDPAEDHQARQLSPSTLYARRRGGAGAPGGNQRATQHLLLRRLLALRLS